MKGTFSEGNHGVYDLCIIYETDIAEKLHSFGFDRQIKWMKNANVLKISLINEFYFPDTVQ